MTSDKKEQDQAERDGRREVSFWGEVKDIYRRTWTLVLILALVLVGSAVVFYVGSKDGWGIVPAFTQEGVSGPAEVTFGDCLHFSAVTVTTLGYGDFRPVSYGRLVAAMEAMAGLILIGVFVSRLVGKHQEHLAKRLMHRR